MAGKEALNALFKTPNNLKGFNKILEKVVINSAGQGNCQAEFTVTEDMTNRGGTLHGGCTATLIDVISTIGLTTKSENVPGVSVNLNVSYLKAANEGEEVLVDSKTVRMGKKLAFLDVILKKKSTGEVIATGNHVKYIGG